MRLLSVKAASSKEKGRPRPDALLFVWSDFLY